MDADKNAGVISDFGSETGPIADAAQLTDPCSSGRAEAKPQEAASRSDSPTPSCRLLSHLRPSESSADNDLLSFERGDQAEAARLWKGVLAECPGDPEALAKLLASA